MKALIQIHHKALSLDHPDQLQAQAVARTLALKNPTLTDYDNAYSRFVGGLGSDFPFPDVTTYHGWSSCHNALKDIEVPYISINAADDPIVHRVPVDGGDDNPYVVMTLTSQGSHLAWYQNATEKWITRPILEWLQTFGEHVLPDPARCGIPLHVDDDGYVREVGNHNLGCKECEGGGVVEGNIDWLEVYMKTGTLPY